VSLRRLCEIVDGDAAEEGERDNGEGEELAHGGTPKGRGLVNRRRRDRRANA
jgi:hypothetical protein